MIKALMRFYRQWQTLFLAVLTLAVFAWSAVRIFGLQLNVLWQQFTLALFLLMLMMVLAFFVVYLYKKMKAKRRSS